MILRRIGRPLPLRSWYHWYLDANLLVAPRMIRNWRGEGILCSLGNEKALWDYVASKGVPAVDLSTWRTNLQLPRVLADNRAIGHLGAEHFLHYEHTNFAWFSSTRSPYGDLRFEGFQSASAPKMYKDMGLLIGSYVAPVKKECLSYLRLPVFVAL